MGVAWKAQCVYIVGIMKLQRVSPFRPGFALIATISVLLLLTLVAVAFLSLSALTVRTARDDWAREEARANARLGLMIAFGELQREMGPDRRISASASILDREPDSLKIDGVDHPNWLGVFSTVYEGNQNGSPWSRDDEYNGGMADARGGTAYRARDVVKGYLVSGNEGGKGKMSGKRQFLDAINANLGNGDEQVNIVGPGSVNNLDDQVFVKRVSTEKEKLLPNGTKDYRDLGGYGFWVGSLGAKAAVSVADTHREKTIDGKGGGIQRLINAQDVEAAVIDGIADVVEDEAAKLITLNTMALVHPRNKEAIKDNFHNITGYSRGVLANVRDGGLKRDLTAYILSDGSIPDLSSEAAHYQGLDDEDFLVGPINEKMAGFRGFDWDSSRYKEIAPTFGVFREWFLFSQTNSFNRKTMDQVTPERWRNPPSADDGDGFYDRTNKSTVAFTPFTKPNITPLLTEANMYYNVGYKKVGSGTTAKYRLSLCMYPRVALWNPYSVDLEVPAMTCQLFINGNKRIEVTTASGLRYQNIYFGQTGASPGQPGRQSGNLSGMIFMQIPSSNIPAGQSLVFSPAASAPLDAINFSNNRLSASVAPSASRCFYQDYIGQQSVGGSMISDLQLDGPPTSVREVPDSGRINGADNYMVSLRLNEGRANINYSTFAQLPLFSVANISLQAGGSDELPLELITTFPVTDITTGFDQLPEPSVFTRDGFRLRWWKETQSNTLNSGKLTKTDGAHLQSAALGTWNLRGAYYTRTPFDNVSDTPPYFHGIYMRDFPDTEVTFSDMTPVKRDGLNTTFPFTSPNAGPSGLIAFELPSKDVGLPSISYLRHLKLSEFAWHPSYAIGNSLVDPRVERTGTSPLLTGSSEQKYTGWNGYFLGRGSRGGSKFEGEYWAWLIRTILFDTMKENNLIYDQSFELNFNLWDDFFVSTGTINQKQRFADDPGANPLPNGRFGVFDGGEDLSDDLLDFHRAASRLSLEGAFDVHSTSKQAWKAILSSTRDIGFGSKGVTPYPRLLSKDNRDYLGDRINEAAYDGFRSLQVDEIDALAEAIVYEVKTRAPFFGLADFVNRRLTMDETGREGAIEAAIYRAGINDTLISEYPINRDYELPDVNLVVAGQANIADSTRLRQVDKPPSTAWGIPGYLTQGDVLQIIGSTLSARSDSFVIRSYGESKDVSGKIQARAWCEARVQRTPEPMNPDREGLNPEAVSGSTVDFGRRFRIVSFRWLGKDEV